MINQFGYTEILKDNKRFIIVDEEVRFIIELIFKSYANGLGFGKICILLNKNEYPTPSEQKRLEYGDRGKTYKRQITTIWESRTVKLILLNPIYTGQLPPNNYTKSIRCKENFEAIISQEDFRMVQNIHRNKLNNIPQRKYSYDYIFRGFIKCDYGHYCKGVTIFLRYNKIRREYNCSKYLRYGNSECDNHAFPESELLELFKQYLQKTRERYKYILDNINYKKKNIIEKLNYIINIFDEIIASEIPDRNLLKLVLDKIILNKIRTVEFKLQNDFIIGDDGRIENLFKGLIYCSCGKKFNGKVESKTYNYICSGYKNYGADFCPRNVLHQEDLLHLVKLHLGIKLLTKEIIEDNIIRIEVKGSLITIYYLDGTISKWNNKELKI